MTVTPFLIAPENSVTREKMFFNRLYYELKITSAAVGNSLQVFTPEVDRDGFDVILDDGDLVRRFQLKTVLKTAQTASWNPFKRLLRPEFEYAQPLGFRPTPEGIGLGGGVILIGIDSETEGCPLTYYYIDVFILIAFHFGMISGASNTRTQQVEKLLAELSSGIGREKAYAPKGVFVKLRSVSALLAICGMHGPHRGADWWGNLLLALGSGFRTEETPFVKETAERTATAQAHQAIESLLTLLDEPDLRIFKHELGPAF